MENIKLIVEEIKQEPTRPEEIKKITPAQDFIDDKTFVTVKLPELHETKVGNEYVLVPYLITSERRKIKLTAEELVKMGYHTDRNPDPENRWSNTSIKEFLFGNDKGVTFLEVHDCLKKLYDEYVDFGQNPFSSLMSIWVIGTHFHRMFNAYPYIHLNGHMETGKSKTISLTTLLSFNGEMNVGSTAAFLIRTIHDNNATCGIDEAENLRTDEDSQVLIGMCNAGYKKGTMIGKSVPHGKDGWKSKRLDPYSPKIFGGIKRLATTLTSRSIPVLMTRTTNKEVKNREVDSSDPRLQSLRDNLYLLMMTRYQEVRAIYKTIRDDEIIGREWELWKPILTLAKTVGRVEYKELRKLALNLQVQKKDMIEEDTSIVEFLESLEFMFETCPQPDDFYTPSEIKSALTDYNNPHNESFSWMVKSDKSHSRWIGDELRKMGVIEGSAFQKKVSGVNRRGYYLNLATIKDKKQAYQGLPTTVTPVTVLPKTDLQINEVTEVTEVTEKTNESQSEIKF